MQYRGVYCPNVHNLGDFLNCFPVMSGLAKASGEPLRFVVPDSFKQFNGFREFMEYQPCIKELFFHSEIYGIDLEQYIIGTYHQDDMKWMYGKQERVCPYEASRWEEFIKNNYPNLPTWTVDLGFTLMTPMHMEDYYYDCFWIGDRWSKVHDQRRKTNPLRSCGMFDYDTRWQFLDFENHSMLDVVGLMLGTDKPFIGTFTGVSVIADLLNKENVVFYDNEIEMWDNMPIEYSFNKHYFPDRKSILMKLNQENVEKVFNGTYRI